MSQAALNTRNHEEEDETSSRRSNGSRLAGIFFLLAVLCTVLVSGWMVLGWMEDAQRLPLSKMVVTGERHYTRNDDIRQAILALGSPGTFMTQDDVENVVHTAKSVRVRDEHRVLHVIPQEYAIDYQEGIKNPVGLSGVRMQAKVHLITCHNDMAKNIVKAVERCGLKVDQLIFAGLAASYSVLTEDERELGVCVVDIGGGTMDIAVYTGGALRHTKVIPYAGNVVTSDIAYAFGTPPSDAEAIKVRHGCALGSIVGKDENVEVPSVGGRPPRSLQRQTLAEVIEPRYTELLNLVNEEILQLQEQLRQQGVKHHLAAGIVLTGGAAQIEGLAACAQRVFHTQVRIGAPLNITGLTDYAQEPYYSTAVGLLHYGKESHLSGEAEVEKRVTVGSWIKRLNSWVRKEI